MKHFILGFLLAAGIVTGVFLYTQKSNPCPVCEFSKAAAQDYEHNFCVLNANKARDVCNHYFYQKYLLHIDTYDVGEKVCNALYGF